MKQFLSSRGLFILAFVLLAATNIVVLAGVAYNRSGPSETLITLTERELPLPYRVYEENSGLNLRMVWRVLGTDTDDHTYRSWGYPAWFTADKLRALGFQLDDGVKTDTNRTDAKEPIPKEVFIVLEKDGAAYREAVNRAEQAVAYEGGLYRANSGEKRLRENFENAAKRLERERISESRLFAVDAGLDPSVLRITYADRARFIIARGLVKPAYHYEKNWMRVRGHITRLSVESIHVPLDQRKLFDAILARDSTREPELTPPRYAVDLAYGRRFEPWIVSVKAIEGTSD